MGGEEPARDIPRSDHGRGRARFAHDRLSVPAAAMLPGHRWRRRADPDIRRSRQGLSHQACLHPRHRRKRRDADGEPDGEFCQFARLRRRGADRVPRGRHHAQGRRSPDDLRRVRAPAAVRAGGSGLRAARRGRPLHRRTQHSDRQQAAAQHQWRRAVVYALRHVRHVCAAGERAPDARHRTGADTGREDLRLPRCRRHVRRIGHDHLQQPEAVGGGPR